MHSIWATTVQFGICAYTEPILIECNADEILAFLMPEKSKYEEKYYEWKIFLDI